MDVWAVKPARGTLYESTFWPLTVHVHVARNATATAVGSLEVPSLRALSTTLEK
jgi:hypothetical protein